jgi:hypothetical protein
MEKGVHNLATLIYLAIEAECDVCHRRFAEPEGEGEAGIWEWAQRTAVAAYQAGWRDVGDSPLCPECIPIMHTPLTATQRYELRHEMHRKCPLGAALCPQRLVPLT